MSNENLKQKLHKLKSKLEGSNEENKDHEKDNQNVHEDQLNENDLNEISGGSNDLEEPSVLILK